MRLNCKRVIRFVGLFVLIALLLLPSLALAEVDITDKVEVIKGRMTSDRRTGDALIDVSLRNVSDEIFLSPIKVIINISDPDVTLSDPDGYTHDDVPYILYQGADINPDSNEFNPLTVTGIKRIRFFNPLRKRFVFQTQVLGSEYVSVLEPPTDEVVLEYEIGPDPVSIITKKYTGKVIFPEEASFNYSELVVESGVSGATALSEEMLFKAEMNSEATALMTVSDSFGNSYLMSIFPKAKEIKQVNPVINAKSTAMSIIAIQAGMITGEPWIDAMMMYILSRLPEVEALSNQIEQELNDGTFNLNQPLSESVLTLCKNALEALSLATAEEIVANTIYKKIELNISRAGNFFIQNAWAGELFDGDNCSDEIAAIDGENNDYICLSGDILSAGKESTFSLINTKGRWVSFGYLNEEGSFVGINWIPPRHMSLPGNVLQLAIELGQNFALDLFEAIFDPEDELGFVSELNSLLSNYYGPSNSIAKVIFGTNQQYTLGTIGSAKDMFSCNKRSVLSYFFGVLTEVVKPLLSIGFDFNLPVVSIDKNLTCPNINIYEDFIEAVLLGNIRDILDAAGSDGLAAATKEVINSFPDVFFSEPGYKAIACVLTVNLDGRSASAITLKKLVENLLVINKFLDAANAITSISSFVKTNFFDEISCFDGYSINVEPDSNDDEVLFADDFEDGTIDPSKWEVWGNTVTETVGELLVRTTTVDAGGHAKTVPIQIDPSRPVTIKRNVKVYAANHYFDGQMSVSTVDHPEHRFGVSYADYSYTNNDECVTYGFSIVRNGANSHKCASRDTDQSEIINPIWGQFFDEEIVYNPVTGDLNYHIDGELKITYNVGPMPEGADTIWLDINPWGWWTGHYQHLADIEVSQ